MFKLSHLSLRRGAQLLIDDCSLSIHAGWKVGITGANGTGKSSLLALVLGQLQPDQGDYHLPSAWQIAHVAQQTPDGTASALDYVLDGDAEFRAVERELNDASDDADGKYLAELHERFDHVGGYQAQSKAAQLLHGLGFNDSQLGLAVNSFSGGWRMRLNLAQALMCRSDLLLLDEPTNHLDLDAVIWLENWLATYPGTLLLISHDRDFLDRVTSHIAHIEQQQLTLYTGNYSAFEHTRAERLANQHAAYEKQQRERAHMQQYVDRFRAKATKARQAQSRLKALDRMIEIAPAHVDSPFHFSFREPLHNPRPLLDLEDITAGYDPDSPLLHGVGMTFNPGDRVGLLGRNGAGKSTLIKVLAGSLKPFDGQLRAARNLKIGYFAQHQLEQLHPEHSPLDHLRQIDAETPEQQLRDFLGSFGFVGDQALALTGPFSGGEKSRLALALIIYQQPNLLLLDEPTNHLDLEMRLALAQALQSFEGAMVIVSHDRHLLRVATDTLLLVDQGSVTEFKDDLDGYPAWLAKRARVDAGSEQKTAPRDRKAEKRESAERRKALAPLTRRVSEAERDLEAEQQRLAELEGKLADPAMYKEENKAELQKLLADKRSIDARCEQLEQEWMEASEALESRQAELS